MQRHPMQTTHKDVQGVKALAPRIQAAEAVIAGAEVVCIYMEPAVRTGLSDALTGTLRSMSDALLARCRLCLRERGGSIEHLPRN